MQRFCPRGAIPFHQLSWWLGLSAVNGISQQLFVLNDQYFHNDLSLFLFDYYNTFPN